jgi:hypothetical protein
VDVHERKVCPLLAQIRHAEEEGSTTVPLRKGEDLRGPGVHALPRVWRNEDAEGLEEEGGKVEEEGMGECFSQRAMR